MCWAIDQFFEIQTYGIKPLSQHFEKDLYQDVNINIAKFSKAPFLKNIFERLLLKVPMKLRKIKETLNKFDYILKIN